MNHTLKSIKAIYAQPFIDLILQAQNALRTHFKPNTIQLSTLLNIKMGGCPENCGYCSQSVHYSSNIEPYKLLTKKEIVSAAQKAKNKGATRFCLGAAWRGPTHTQIDILADIIPEIKQLGLETCITLGLLKPNQAEKLKSAGLDYYNHNLNSSKKHYKNIVTTHDFNDRLDTIDKVNQAGIQLCCGGILGMGENEEERLSMLHSLSKISPTPKSIPINMLTAMPGTPLEGQPKINILEVVKLIATTRILFPSAYVRLSSGRSALPRSEEALCYLAGINSIHFASDYLLTEYSPLPSAESDLSFLATLGIVPETTSS
jgi:biotin synthase